MRTLVPLHSTRTILSRADAVVRRTGTRDPQRIAEALGITVKDVGFHRQKGVYKVIKRNRFVFLKKDLDEVMRSIVLLHEIGHDQLHRQEASIFQEFNLFDMSSSVMEYEANLFSAHIALPDEEIIRYIYDGYDASQIACAMRSDINLVALKVSELSQRGYAFRNLEHRNDFLK